MRQTARMIIIKEGRILLIRRVKDGSEYWVLPGGGIENGESHEQALKREAKEELGTEIAMGEKFYEDRWQKTPTEEVANTFYFCDITGGIVGTGDGPEWQENSGYFGEYHLEWREFKELPTLDLKPNEVRDLLVKKFLDNKTEVAIFAGGCFWCTEAVFNELKGVIKSAPGYSGGAKPNPTYEEVSTGATGHAEVARIEFDPTQISYSDLLTVFFFTHDPTSINRQGNDIGTQYRSAIFYTTPEQKMVAEEFIKNLEKGKAYDKPVVTEVIPLDKFYPAEDYHEKYYEAHKDETYCQLIIEPKIEKLREHFISLLKTPKQ